MLIFFHFGFIKAIKGWMITWYRVFYFKIFIMKWPLQYIISVYRPGKSNGEFWLWIFHSENLAILLPFWFYVKSILAGQKLPFNNFEGWEIWFLEKSHTYKCQKIPEIQNSELLKWSKGKFFGLQNDQNWFHVQSDWQKNPEISTLYIPN